MLPRSHESFVSPLIELLITGFFALYPNGVQRPPYEQFQSDVLNTLGRCMMEPRCWNGDDVVLGSMLHRSNNNPRQVWCWWDASGDFSASMYLCLKYLPPPMIAGWFASVLAIRSRHWRDKVLVWLVGSSDMLRGFVHWPSEFGAEAYPSVDWAWSHCLHPELAASDQLGTSPAAYFLPVNSRVRVLSVARQHFTDDVYLSWLDSIYKVPYLKAELADIPTAFEGLYVEREVDR